MTIPLVTAPPSTDALRSAYEAHRRELVGYLTRLVARQEIAEELAQETAVRALEAERAPDDPAFLRPWLFRIATNLGLDHLRRHGTWRETAMLDARTACTSRGEFVAFSTALHGAPEMRAVAREHLAACFACTLRALPPQEAAALLLREVHGFRTAEVAALLDARVAQAKHWLQSARAAMTAKYAATCALVNKRGVCHQCVELDAYFDAGQGDPLAGTDRSLAARLHILRQLREAPLGRWHMAVMRVIGELLD
jgi:RNA polymerase sigma-70 factor (ECF subfamily)